MIFGVKYSPCLVLKSSVLGSQRVRGCHLEGASVSTNRSGIIKFLELPQREISDQ